MLMSGFEENISESQTQHPAKLAHLKKNQHSMHTFYSLYNFSNIHNITLQNTATSGVSATSGDYDPNPPNQLMAAYHYSLKLSNTWYAQSLGISLIAPLPELMVIDTTSSFLPKYTWYDSKLNKTELYFLLTQKFNAQWSSSVGLVSNWDLVGQSEVTAGLTGGAASSGRIQAKLKPKFFTQLALAYTMQHFAIHLSWNPSSQQELTNQVIGKAPIGGSSTVDYTFRMIAQNHFEPMQSKIDMTLKHLAPWHFLGGISYQDWSNFESNRLQIIDANGVITNSQNYEVLKGKKIFSPALGLEYGETDQTIYSLSYRYRPNVLDKNHNDSGNTLDQNTHIVGMAIKHESELFSIPLSWSFGIQHHYLPTRVITKTANQEDGTAGSKVGAPSYTSGGTFTIMAAGLNYSF